MNRLDAPGSWGAVPGRFLFACWPVQGYAAGNAQMTDQLQTADIRNFLAAADARSLEITRPSSDYLDVPESRPLRLACGKELAPYRIAYKTYGTLNADRSNAILVPHALTLDQYVASPHPVTGKPGWWEIMVGPGKPIDTDRFFVI